MSIREKFTCAFLAAFTPNEEVLAKFASFAVPLTIVVQESRVTLLDELNNGSGSASLMDVDESTADNVDESTATVRDILTIVPSLVASPSIDEVIAANDEVQINATVPLNEQPIVINDVPMIALPIAVLPPCEIAANNPVIGFISAANNTSVTESPLFIHGGLTFVRDVVPVVNIVLGSLIFADGSSQTFAPTIVPKTGTIAEFLENSALALNTLNDHTIALYGVDIMWGHLQDYGWETLNAQALHLVRILKCLAHILGIIFCCLSPVAHRGFIVRDAFGNILENVVTFLVHQAHLNHQIYPVGDPGEAHTNNVFRSLNAQTANNSNLPKLLSNSEAELSKAYAYFLLHPPPILLNHGGLVYISLLLWRSRQIAGLLNVPLTDARVDVLRDIVADLRFFTLTPADTVIVDLLAVLDFVIDRYEHFPAPIFLKYFILESHYTIRSHLRAINGEATPAAQKFFDLLFVDHGLTNRGGYFTNAPLLISPLPLEYSWHNGAPIVYHQQLPILLPHNVVATLAEINILRNHYDDNLFNNFNPADVTQALRVLCNTRAVRRTVRMFHAPIVTEIISILTNNW